MDYKLSHHAPFQKVVTYRDFRNCDNNKLSHDLIEKFSYLIEHSSMPDFSLEKIVDLFYNSVDTCLNANSLFRTYKFRKPSAPWIPPEIRQRFKQRDNMYKSAKRCNNQSFLSSYKKLRTNLKKM